MKRPLSLSMMKMEKNFVAHLEKKYQRKPYLRYPIFIRGNADQSLIGFVWREMIELNKAIDPLALKRVGVVYPRFEGTRKEISDNLIAAMWEVADVSNTLDYLFEALIQEYTNLEDEI